MDALTTYTLVAANPARAIERTESRPDIAREIEYYRANISSVKSAEDLVQDFRLFNFVMRAYGLEDLGYARAFMRKIMEEGIDDPEALSNRLNDPRYRELATDFNFDRYDSAVTTFERASEGVIDKFIRQSMEIEAGAQNEGARLALYFERKASEVTSELDILSDKALLAVVQTGLQLPSQMGLASLDNQVDMIKDRFDITDLQDPEKLKELIGRFLALWEVSNPSGAPTVPLIGNTTPSIGLSVDLLASLQSIKKF